MFVCMTLPAGEKNASSGKTQFEAEGTCFVD